VQERVQVFGLLGWECENLGNSLYWAKAGFLIWLDGLGRLLTRIFNTESRYCDLRDNDEELRNGNNRGTFRALLAEMVNGFASSVLFNSRGPLGRVMICPSQLPKLWDIVMLAIS
jgi:hypothetical protein